MWEEFQRKRLFSIWHFLIGWIINLTYRYLRCRRAREHGRRTRVVWRYFHIRFYLFVLLHPLRYPLPWRRWWRSIIVARRGGCYGRFHGDFLHWGRLDGNCIEGVWIIVAAPSFLYDVIGGIQVSGLAFGHSRVLFVCHLFSSVRY